MNISRRVLVLRGLGSLLVCGYLYFNEAGIRNLQTLTNLVFDQSTCAERGRSREEVNKCLKNLGNDPVAMDGHTDRIVPPLLFDGFSRDYHLFLDYDQQGKLINSQLMTFIGFL